jgi:hypothetical protein
MQTTRRDTATPDPHPAWLEQWRQCRDRINAARALEEGDEELDALLEEYDRTKLLICDTPATTTAGLAAQLYAFLDELVGHELTDGPDRRLFENMLAALRAA